MKTQLIALGVLLFSTCDLLIGCDADADGDREVRAAADEAEPALGVHAGGRARADVRPDSTSFSSPDAPRVVPNAKQTFDEVLSLVQSKYVEGPLAEDVLWSGAIDGLLGRLVQLREHPVNALLDPRELAELEAGTRGSIVGVGIAIELVADVVVVREVIPGSPAAHANLAAGDRILGVDGVRLRDMSLVDVVGRIRGESGSEVSLFVQRDTEEWTETVERGAVQFDTVKSELLDGGVGVLRISSFSAQTAEDARTQLQALSARGMTSLVLDVRACPGGLLESAIDTASLLLPPGQDVVVLERRDAEDDVRRSEGSTPWQSLDVVSLVGPRTASGAEIVVEALAAAGRTVVVGEETLGKATVESIHELDNGWALKLSISRFHAPGSDRAVGEGIQPDIVVSGESAGERDVQLDAALKLLERR